MFVWKRPKINEKEAGVGPFFKKKKKKNTILDDSTVLRFDDFGTCTTDNGAAFCDMKLCDVKNNILSVVSQSQFLHFQLPTTYRTL